MQIKLIDYNVSIWIIGFSLIMAYVCPLESMATQRGVILIKDEHGKEVGLYRESYALLIGVSNYTKGWPDLESVPHEIKQVESALGEQGFHIVKRLDTNAAELEKAFEGFIRTYGYDPENRLLFFFAGHGHTWPEAGQGYLVPADTPRPAKKTGDPGPEFLRKALHI